jgi:ribosomal-protein-alanine N-acetyltransferase
MNIMLKDVVLRRPEPKDVEQLYIYRNDEEVIKYLGGFSTGYAIQDLKEWIESHRKRTDEIIWIIADKEQDRCLGHVGLYKIDHRVRTAEFAILLGDKTSWGKGIGKQVSSAIIAYGFRQLHLHRIQLEVLATNPRAKHLYDTLGFKQEGTLRDGQFRDGNYIEIVIMGLLENEWT